jgi:Arc/MetJ-type ribon-helix-helix transcriptional regulator
LQYSTTKHNEALLIPAKFPHGSPENQVSTLALRPPWWYFLLPKSVGAIVSKAVKKAISLPADLAAEVEAIARDENKSLSAVVQDALRAMKRSRLRGEFRDLQGYWSNRARTAGVLSERDLERLLRR